MKNLRIVIAEDEWITRVDLVEILEESGYLVESQAKDGIEAVEACRKHKPDVAILDMDMPMINGLDVARILKEEKLAKCVIILTAFTDPEIVKEASQVGVMSYLVKPFDQKSLIPAIEVAYANQLEVNKVKKDLQDLEKKFEERKLIDRAKGILIDKYKYSEDLAYKTLQKMAMDNRTTLVNVASSLVYSRNKKSQ